MAAMASGEERCRRRDRDQPTFGSRRLRRPARAVSAAARHIRRDDRRRRFDPAALGRVPRRPEGYVRRRTGQALAPRRTAAARERPDVHGGPDGPRGSALGSRFRAGADRRRRMAHAGAGIDPARPPAERHPRRPLWPADPASRRSPACRRRPGQPALPAPVSRLPAARRSVPARVCGGPRARAGRPLVGARRPHAGAVRRRLRAREPGHPLPLSSRDVPGFARSQARRLLPVDAPQPGRRHRPGKSESGSAEPGSGRRRLLRARVSRPLSRLHARRGRRSHRPRQSRLSEIGGWTEAGRPDPAAHGSGGVRSAGAALRFDAGRRRADAGDARRKCRRGQRARQRLGGNQGDAAVPAALVPPTVL